MLLYKLIASKNKNLTSKHMQQIAAVIMIMFDWLSDSATIQAITHNM